MYFDVEPTSLDIPTILKLAPELGVTGLCLLIAAAFVRNWVYSRGTYDAMCAQLQGQINAKDAALVRKDQQIQQLHDQNASLNQGMLDVAVPALSRAAQIMEHFHTETTVRRTGE